jgi:HlyD family secretion protein
MTERRTARGESLAAYSVTPDSHHRLLTPKAAAKFLAVLAATLAAACASKPPPDRVRASGQVEATDVPVAAPVGGRVIQLGVDEGDRVNAGDPIATLDTADAQLGLGRARAERDQANAQLRLLRAGSRPEDIRQAEAQVAAAQADAGAAEVELASAEADVARFEALLASNSGSRKQRDDAVTRRDVAEKRVQASRDRIRAAAENAARLRAGSRPEEIDGARARIAAADVQIATWHKAIADATIVAPIAGIVTQTLIDVGELAAPRAPIVVVTDLDRAWANVYVDEPIVPRLRVGQPLTVLTDAGGAGIPGTIAVIAEKAEFTPRNVQTAKERVNLVFRVKLTVTRADDRLKPGMPADAVIATE